MHWGILGLSLVVSISLALIFVKLILVLGLKDQLSVVIPLLPIFYGLVFPALERTLGKSDSRSKAQNFYYSPRSWQSNLWVVVIAALASIVTQCGMDAATWLVNRHFILHQSLPELAGVGARPLAKLFVGNMTPLGGGYRISYLTIQMIVVSLVGGICAGLLSKANPLMNGLLSGVIVSVWMGTNQFSALFQQLTEISTQVTAHFHISTRWGNGVLIGLFIQVFLFALFSGIASRYQFSGNWFRRKLKRY